MAKVTDLVARNAANCTLETRLKSLAANKARAGRTSTPHVTKVSLWIKRYIVVAS
jgi:hypothetical protein